jgi:hypothetical protein
MRKLEIEIPESVMIKAIQQYGSRKKVEDIIANRLEQNIRKNRRIIGRVSPERMTIVNVYVKDHLYPFFNEILISMAETKQNYVLRMLKRLTK